MAFDVASSPPPNRILICGCTGSGKSTLAAKLSTFTGLPHIRADDLTFRPGWQSVSPDEQRVIFTDICMDDAWILDHAYSIWRDIAVEQADLIIALDYPRWVSLSRLLKRSIARAWTREPVCNGNIETFRKLFSNDSIIAWHFKSFPSKRRFIRGLEESDVARKLVVVRHPSEVGSLVERLRAKHREAER